jgi:lysozyme
MSKLVQMLRLHEGVRYKVYMCSEGYETIGVGRNISEGGLGLSKDEVDFLLVNDIKRVQDELTRSYPWFARLDEVRRDAMVDICFNIGLTKLRGFVNALAAMSRNQYEIAADEFMDSRWSEQVGNRAVEVTEMIRTGEYPQLQ